MVVLVPGHFGYGSFRFPGRFCPWLIQSRVVLVPGRFGPGPFRSQVVSVPGHFDHRSFRSRVVSDRFISDRVVSDRVISGPGSWLYMCYLPTYLPTSTCDL